MSFALKRFSITCSVLLLTSAVFAQQQLTDAQIADAASTLLKTRNAPAAWKVMGKIYSDEKAPADLRSRVVYLSAVKRLIEMDTKRYESALKNLQEEYPAEGKKLASRIAPEDWQSPCRECKGTGKRPPLVGKGAPVRCMNCLGTGKIFAPSKRVSSEYLTLLKEIRGIAETNQAVSQSVKKAFSQKNIDRRIEAFRELLAAYPDRKDLGESRKELARLEAEVKAKAERELKRRQAEEARQQEEKHYAQITEAAEGASSATIPVLVKNIEEFIRKHPKSSYCFDLQLLQAKLEKKKMVQEWIWRGMWILIAAALVGALVSCIKNAIATRSKKKDDEPLALPGLAQSADDADPLAGMFSDEEDKKSKSH